MPILPGPSSTTILGPPGPTTATPLGGVFTSGYDLTVRQNDGEYAVTWVLKDNGIPLVIPSGATVAFAMTVLGDADTLTGGGAADLVDGANGKVSYAWQTVDIATPGSYSATFTVTYLGGLTRTYPNTRDLRILVTPKLGL